MTGESVTVQSPTSTEDRYGAEVDDWSDPAETVVHRCLWAPSTQPEDRASGRQGVTDTGTLYLPAGAAIAATDRVVVRGLTYEVDGKPAAWSDGSSTAGTEVTLRRVLG